MRSKSAVFKSSMGETAGLSFMDMLPDEDISAVGPPPSGSRTNSQRWTPEPTGFPQGANISPFLSILTMSCGPPPKFAQLVMYADDGIFYSDSAFDAAEVSAWFEHVGVKLNEEKSGWVRQGGD